MKSGNIHQFSSLSQFQTIEQFNETIKQTLATYKDEFTKGEIIAFQTLTRFSVKKIGICNARICKLVEATQTKKGGVSRSTFERMLRKAKKLGILTIHHTTRKKGGLSHNVYVFHPFDGTPPKKLTERPTTKTQEKSTVAAPKIAPETTKIKNKINHKDLRPITLETLDYTYVPSYVPDEFIKTVRPFFDRAKEICQLWDRATIAFRSMKFHTHIDQLLPTIIKAFKQTVYHWKQKKIKTSFLPYYYGTLAGMLIAEKRKTVAEQRQFHDWLVE